MKDKELYQIGIPKGAALNAARQGAEAAAKAGLHHKTIRRLLKRVVKNPTMHVGHIYFASMAQLLAAAQQDFVETKLPETRAPFQQWGTDLDVKSIQQMHNACSLPVSVRGALMPDAHVGYGLPIGGVLATKGAVIPYAVGVDIACRMKMTVLELPPKTLTRDLDRLKKAIESETRFGIGSQFKGQRREHSVMDQDWDRIQITKRYKDKAWAQLGTSGSGNHFVEFGTLDVRDPSVGLDEGTYLALLSHSGSRGTGAEVCGYYSRLAMDQHRNLPRELKHLAWLDLNSHAGQEYWAAMTLMGDYAAANHACIHHHIARHLGVRVLLDIENHHNFAWKEHHDGEDVIVHRKGATPASAGAIGIIPGSMATPGYVVRGKGNAASLNSAAHGAGRVMSRTQAKKTFRWSDAKPKLQNAKVTVMSAGIDEVPMVYKNIDQVMAAQADLVDVLAQFHPRLVKMAPAGERPED